MLAKYLEELRDNDLPLSTSRVAVLSDLSGEELKLFQNAWKKIPVRRRQDIISQLVLIAQENFEFTFDSIFKSCLEDPDAVVRAKAVEGLWDSEDPSLVSSLVKLLKEDREEGVRAKAAIALGGFALLAEWGELGFYYAKRVKDALLSVIDNARESVEVRRRTVEVISGFNFPRVKTIIKEAYHSGETGMQGSAIFAMGRNGDPSWLPFLLKELDNPSPEIRLEAAKACGELEEEEAVPYLSRLGADAEREVQLEALISLGKIGGEKAKQALRRWLHHPDQQIRQIAREAWEEAMFKEDALRLIDLYTEDEE